MHPIIIVLATRNRGKSQEIRRVLAEYPIDFRDLNDFGVLPDVVEDGLTFEENAYKKSSFYARILGFPALADDSGLVVEALNGAPGVLSARYAGMDATDEKNIQKLLAAMDGQANRAAAFVCVLSLAMPGGAALTYEAECGGLITTQPVGQNGFGYDPVFYYPPLEKTFAQLTMPEKNSVSHRGKAFNEFRSELDKIMTWIGQRQGEI
ncbi:MAG: XTP/dITP diphosphatase [Deltaproteobacteria bacterium]|nr:XTP/dITP diphosphatase [Deltaproteobacteria bacterium]